MLYGPLWFKNSVVKIDPANGAVTVINREFKTPAAANLDGKGNLYVVDTATGELARVELGTGRKTVVAKLKIRARQPGRRARRHGLRVEHGRQLDRGLQPDDRRVRAAHQRQARRALGPQGRRAAACGWPTSLRCAPSTSPRGAVTDVQRMHATDSDMEYPFAVGVSSKQIAISSWFTGWVQVLDRATQKTVANLHGWKAPYDALPMEDGSLLVAEIATGSITQASGTDYKTRRVVTSGLDGPVQMILGRDGALYVTEAAGKLTRVNLADGTKTEVASGLALPEGVAQTPWGSFHRRRVGRRQTDRDRPRQRPAPHRGRTAADRPERRPRTAAARRGHWRHGRCRGQRLLQRRPQQRDLSDTAATLSAGRRRIRPRSGAGAA